MSRMNIDKAIEVLLTTGSSGEEIPAKSVAVRTMRKYQKKIQEIYQKWNMFEYNDDEAMHLFGEVIKHD